VQVKYVGLPVIDHPEQVTDRPQIELSSPETGRENALLAQEVGARIFPAQCADLDLVSIRVIQRDSICDLTPWAVDLRAIHAQLVHYMQDSQRLSDRLALHGLG
jgi:hypothetical protein